MTSKACVFDLETDIYTLYKRKASPWHPDNMVVAAGWQHLPKDKKPKGKYFGKAGDEGSSWFTDMLSNTKCLVGHNIKFDILYALRREENYKAWMQWVAKGGTIWDTQLAEYLLEGMTNDSQMCAMDDIAEKYGGNLKIDEVKALWSQGVTTQDIDEDLLMEYLIGSANKVGDLGDIGNTKNIFLGQVKKAKAQSQMQSIRMNMDALICTIEMEFNGLYTDKELGLEISEELRQRRDKLEEDLRDALPVEVKESFNWNSRQQVSALLFGGPVTVRERHIVKDENGNPKYPQKEVLEYKLVDGSYTTEEPIEDDSSYEKFKSGKKAGEYKTRKTKVDDTEKEPRKRWEEKEVHLTQQVKPDEEWETSTPGVYSVNEEVMNELSDSGIKIVDLFGEFVALNKDLSTYFITEDSQGNQKGMLTLVGEDGFIHHQLQHTSTVTGRLSSKTPNLQNVASGDKSRIKEIFESRYQDGRIIQSDYSSLESYIQAILANDSALLQDLRDGLDLHSKRGSQISGDSYEDFYQKAKVEEDPKYVRLRQAAKAFTFARAYGAGKKSLAKSTGLSEEEVERLMEAEDAMYPGIPAFKESVEAEIEQTRRPSSRVIQHPEIPGVTCHLDLGYYRAPDGKIYSFRQSPAPEWLIRDTKQTSSFKPTEIANYPVQGMGGEWIKAAMGIVIRMFYKTGNFKGKALLINSVHDAIYADASAEVAPKATALIEACMIKATDKMRKLFNWDIPIDIPADSTVGLSMAEEGHPSDSHERMVQKYLKIIDNQEVY